MYGIRRYFIGVNNKKDNYFCYSPRITSKDKQAYETKK